MDKKTTFPVSVLDLAVITEGGSPAQAFKNSVELAQKAEQLHYTRYWFAEHHNMASVASSATSILIGHIASATHSIRVGSGGIMLPNHAPLVIAEQFGTLASLYPGRIDLGLGRAPGTDQPTMMALRRDKPLANDFGAQIAELMKYLSAENSNGLVRAIPGEGLNIPIWILGSSTDSAYLAASLGLPYTFASHFAPAQLHDALKIYRMHFQPSQFLQSPYTMACVNVVAADTDALAQRMATSFYQLFLGIIRGSRRPLPPPVDSMKEIWTPNEQAVAMQMLSCSFTGSAKTIQEDLQSFIIETGIDELMVTSHIYDHAARVHSYEILAEVIKKTGLVTG